MSALYEVKGIGGQLAVYADKVVITRKGFIGLVDYGHAGEKVIPMSSIQSVQFKAGGFLFNGFIQFGILGGREAQNGVFNAAQDENSVILRMGEQSEMGERIKNYIEKRILERENAGKTPVQQVSAADEILKLKQLLDMNAITQEEFDAKKKQLLRL